ncbi:MAG: Tyrosine-protein kinase ptk [Verrucomicrobia subdivision 3 bacterium]|nr:Tyrosine-protein kinase ptk [Limisphaerales bacterium]MCS1416032.1 Tyrosine-protein kinase ptk [Limisphaerales bacterium]
MPPVRDASRGFGSMTEEKANAKYYWYVLLERRWLVITTFVTTLALGVIYLFKAVAVYEAESMVQIDTVEPNILKGTERLVTDVRRSHLLNTEQKKVISRTLVQKVVDQLDLRADPRFRDSNDVVQSVADSINVTPIRFTQLLKIGFEHTDPKQAAKIANTLVDEFVKQNRETKVGKLADLHFYLEDEFQSTKEKLNIARQKMQDYRESHGTVSLEKDQDITLRALIQAQTDYARAESEEAAVRSIAEAIQSHLAAGKPLETIPQIASDPQIIALQQSLTKAEAHLQSLLVTYKEGWPAVKELKKQIASLKQSLAKTANDVLPATLLAAEQAKAKLDSLAALVKVRETAQLKLNKQRIHYDIESRDAEHLYILYNTLLSRLEEVRIAQRSYASSITVVDYAHDPLEPVKPRVAFTLLFLVFGGLVLGVGSAFFVNFLDDSIKTQEDVEAYLGLTFLGYIARIKGGENSERSQESFINPQSVVSESFRTLRATISLLPNGSSYRMIAVSSTKSGEGKSLTASNLAIVWAQAGSKTLLVDSDLRRPALHEIHRLLNTYGLTDFLTEQKDFKDIIQSGQIPNLDFTTSGPIPRNPSELLSSERFSQFINEARRNYDRVVIDCPPISAVSDPLSISSQCDGIIFISRFNEIRREHARRTVQRLKEAGVQMIGALINNISVDNSYGYYYSDYYYKPYKSEETAKSGRDKESPKAEEIKAGTGA